MPDTLGERLRRARRAADLTQAQVSERTGLGRSRLAEWENDASVPRLDTLQKLAALYGVGLDELSATGRPVPDAPSAGKPDTAPANGPAPPPPPNGVHAPSYWRGRMEGAQRAAALVRGLATTIEHAAVSLEGDVRGIIDSGLLNDTGAPTTLDPTPSAEVMAEARRLLDLYLAQYGIAAPPNDEPPARHPRRAGGKG